MQRAWLVFWLSLLTAAGVARADEPTTVVFFAPLQLDAELRGALEDALGAQLMQLPARLQLELRADPVGAIEKRMEVLKHAAREHDAVALFWLEVRTSGRWFLYAIDPRAERVVLRPLDTKPDSPEAALEAVALIVRATTDALMHGQPLPAATAENPTNSPPVASAAADEPDKPTKPWPVVPAVPPRSSLRLAASYVGTTFARRIPWQNGIALRAAWIWPSGSYVGAGYTFFEAAEFDRPDLRFVIDRYPISLHAGLRFPVDDFTFSGELGAEIEVRTRRTDYAGMFMPRPEERRFIYSVCPKLETEYTVTSWLRVFVNFGLDFVLGNFPYILDLRPPGSTEPLQGSMGQVVVEPHWMRLTAQVGIGIVR